MGKLKTKNFHDFLMWIVCFFFFYWWAVTHPSIPIEPWAPLSICFIRPCDKGSRTHRIKGFKNLKSSGPKIFLESADINSFHMPDFSLKSMHQRIDHNLDSSVNMPLHSQIEFCLVNNDVNSPENVTKNVYKRQKINYCRPKTKIATYRKKILIRKFGKKDDKLT